MKKQYFLLLFILVAIACTHRSSFSDMGEKEARTIMQDVSERNRTYQPLTERDDTLMQRVVAYYKEYGTCNELMEAYYLLGSVYRDLHEAPKAMEAFLEGINLADTASTNCNYVMLTRLYTQKVELLDKQRLYRLSSEDEKLVYQYAILANDSLFALSSLWSRLGSLYLIKDYHTVSDECKDLLEMSRGWGMLTYAAGQLIPCVLANLELHEIEDAQYLMNVFEKYSGDVNLTTHESTFPIYYYAKGRLLAAEHKLDSAEFFFRKELKEKDWNNCQAAYRGLREIFEQTGRLDSAIRYARLQCDAVDSAYQEMLSANLQNLHELYDYSRTQNDNYQKSYQLKEKQRKLQTIGLMMCVIVVMALFVFYYMYSRYQKRVAITEMELERANMELREMVERMDLLNERIIHAGNEEERKRLLDELEQARMGKEEQLQVIRDKESLLNEMRKSARRMQGQKKERYEHTTLFKYLHAKSKNNKVAQPKDVQQVKSMLLADDAELLHRLHSETPDITDIEQVMFLLLRLGLSRADVSRLIARDQSSLSAICNRLFQRVKGRAPVNSAEAYNWLLNL